jgi:hypothetical protein
MTSIEKKQKHFYRLIDLVNAIPEIKWNIYNLIVNPRLSTDDCLEIVSSESNKYTKKNLIDNLSINPNITIDFIKSTPFPLNIPDVTRRSNISLLQISQNLDIKWDKLLIAFKYTKYTLNEDNNLIPILFADNMHIINDNKHDDLKDMDKNLTQQSQNKNKEIWKTLTKDVNMDYIISNLQLPWVYKQITYNESLRLRHINFLGDSIKLNIDYLSKILPLQELISTK